MGESGAQMLRSRLERLQAIWVWVDQDGGACHGIPYDRPELDMYGPQGRPDWVDIMGSPLEKVIDWAKDFLTRYPDFIALVSVLSEAPHQVSRVREMLSPLGARELDPTEYDVLQELGMEVPFGNWARRDRAIVFLLE